MREVGDWRHPVVGLWPVALREDLRHAIIVDDLRKIEVWTARHGVALAEWPTEPVDPFFNVNTPEDVDKATSLPPGCTDPLVPRKRDPSLFVKNSMRFAGMSGKS